LGVLAAVGLRVVKLLGNHLILDYHGYHLLQVSLRTLSPISFLDSAEEKKSLPDINAETGIPNNNMHFQMYFTLVIIEPTRFNYSFLPVSMNLPVAYGAMSFTLKICESAKHQCKKGTVRLWCASDVFHREYVAIRL
jgi:hypothetical protein